MQEQKNTNPTTLSEALFFQELRRADEQVIKFHPIFVKYHSSLKNATNLFNQVSNKPSEANVTTLKSVIGNVALRFEELADWCEKRAQSWPDFVDSYELHKSQKKEKRAY